MEAASNLVNPKPVREFLYKLGLGGSIPVGYTESLQIQDTELRFSVIAAQHQSATLILDWRIFFIYRQKRTARKGIRRMLGEWAEGT